LIKCKYCIDQKELETSNTRKREQNPLTKSKQDKLAEKKAKGTDSLVQTKSKTCELKTKGTNSWITKGTGSLEHVSKPESKTN